MHLQKAASPIGSACGANEANFAAMEQEAS
jgi:hypothetical protein